MLFPLLLCRSELILTGSSVLMLEGVGLRDVGTYLCRAVSVAGDDVASASLVIYGEGVRV